MKKKPNISRSAYKSHFWETSVALLNKFAKVNVMFTLRQPPFTHHICLSCLFFDGHQMQGSMLVR